MTTDPRPQGAPALTRDEFQELMERVEEFEAPDETEEAIDRHREHLNG